MISITRSLALVVVSLLVATWATDAATPLAHREVLPNGMVLLVAERPAVAIVAVRVFTRAGAVLDPPDRAGLANLTGATLTRGTAKRSGPELAAAIEFVGGSLEACAGSGGGRRPRISRPPFRTRRPALRRRRNRSLAISLSRRSCSAGRPSARSTPTTFRSSWRRTCSAAARHRASTGACVRRAARRTRCTATCPRRATAPRSWWGP